MDLGDLCGMSKVSGGKTPSIRAAVSAREVDISPVRETLKTSSKRLIDTPNEHTDDPARRHKKVKILSWRHKSRHGEGGSRSHSKGKEPIEEPEMLGDSAEEDVSSVFHCLRSMKDLFKTKVGGAEELDEGLERPVGCRRVREGTPPPAAGAGAVYTPLGGVASSSRQGDGIEAVAKAEERASELEKELDKTKRQWDEALQRLEASDKELNEVRSNLSESRGC
ncbi:hypothetical protein B296_00000413 [Ensete ventricosum]|uniref:Uncharacterized protein n=1 Tax=Ensete ventricosum TaxID=4639 RepID=A0A427B435_ENSVE|nr:hypothetical protein B296_00000413 [Ensete ventricosum]